MAVNPAPALELPPGLKCEVLENTSASELNSILRAAARRRLSRGQVLLHAGDPARQFFVLLTGCAQVYTYTHSGQRIIVNRIEPGDTMGGAAVLPGSPHYLMSTEVIEDGEALEWQRPVFRGLMHKIPALADNVLLLAAKLVQRSFAKQVDSVSQTAEQRLAGVLLELVQNDKDCQADVTNEQLADMANTSPFTVARVLSAWTRSGAIRRSRGKVEVRSMAKLSRYQQAG